MSGRHLPIDEPLERRVLLSTGLLDLDPTFGADGIASAGLPYMTGPVPLVVPLAGGKILAVGTGGQSADTTTAVLARFNSDGSLDKTFSGDGIATAFPCDQVVAAVRQSNGKIVIGANAHDSYGHQYPFVARFNQDGSRDGNFGSNGQKSIVPLSIVPSQGLDVANIGELHGIAMAPNEDIAASVQLYTVNGPFEEIVRFDQVGNLKAGFGGKGILFLRLNSGFFSSTTAAFLPNGDLVVGTFNGIAEYDSAGNLISSSGNGPGQPIALLPQPDNSMIVVGSNEIGRFKADLTRDWDFGDAGEFIANTGQIFATSARVAQDAKQRIVVVPRDSPRHYSVPILRFDKDGHSDGSLSQSICSDVLSEVTSLAPLDGDQFLLGLSGLQIGRIAPGPFVVLSPSGVLFVAGTDSNDTITLDRQASKARLNRNGQITDYALDKVERFDLMAHDGDDKVVVTIPTRTDLDLGGGNDQLTVGDSTATPLSEDVIILGGQGNDSITCGNGYFTIDAGRGEDTVFSGNGPCRITSHTGDGNKMITTGDGNDTIAGAEDDTIVSGGGNDEIYLGDGNDSVIAGDGNDTVYGFSGESYVNLGDGVDYIETHGGSWRVDAGWGDDLFDMGRTDFDEIFAGPGADHLTVGANSTIYGGDGADTLTGGSGTTIYGQAGNDIIDGLGHASLFGDDGDDRIHAGHSATIHGGGGKDSIYGSNSNDFLYGDGGKDRVTARNGSDHVYGGPEDDRLDGGAGNDHIYGGRGNDKLYGGDGSDWLVGDSGADQFYAGGGNDTIYSRDSTADLIDAGTGTDSVQGDKSLDTMTSVESILP